MALDISKLDGLVSNPGCVYPVLERILPQCESPNDLHERTLIGIDLSICEFEAAGVEYPNICNNHMHPFECTRQLESKSTWWTTFSGNYRHISLLCTELRPHYELRQALGVYRNITEIYSEYDAELRGSLSELQKARTLLSQDWDMFTKNTHLGQELYSTMQHLAKEVAGMLETVRTNARNTTNYALSVGENLGVNMELSKTLQVALQTHLQHLAYAELELFNLTQASAQMLQSQVALQNQVALIVTKLDSAVTGLSDRTANITSKLEEACGDVQDASESLARATRGVARINSFLEPLFGVLQFAKKTVGIGIILGVVFGYARGRNRGDEVDLMSL